MSTPNQIGLDPISAAGLAAAGLEGRLVTASSAEFDEFAAAVDRGFLGERPSAERVAGRRARFGDNHAVAVYDPASSSPRLPIGTLIAWPMEVTVDAGSFLPMWAISAVTVSATHRRRGIARHLLEGELRQASAAGLPLAGLTVSEATIYGRFGFGVATHAANLTINARRAGWAARRPELGQGSGHVDPIEPETLAADLATLNETTRGRRPGDVAGWPALWQELSGTSPGKPDPRVRGVRYVDPQGAVRGALAYLLEPDAADFSNHRLRVNALLADTSQAYAALWLFALEHDLVGTVSASLRGLDEPLRWMIADQRALTVTERDHHWLRILDVSACLSARRYRCAGTAVLEVEDPLGFAAGAWRLTVDADGAATVERVQHPGSGGERVRLTVAALGSLLLGGVRASTLRAAGLLDGSAAAASWLDVAFLPVAAPVLSYWY